ncbi:uncharacterized protein METZ01_LOCUS352572 [marine metagenome]|uniref:Uncharacterized protein n=1 Tax=marine metagenome TaxID=408172 RepID=A0A382RRY7_9ZZZZ
MKIKNFQGNKFIFSSVLVIQLKVMEGV